MAKRTFTALNLTFSAQSGGTAVASSTYMSMLGGSATQLIDVLEILISGIASASAVAAMTFCRTITLASTPTALAAPNSDGPQSPFTAALAAPGTSFVAATGGPWPSAATTDAKLNLGLNSFGGIIRWNAAPTQQWQMFGSTIGSGESVLYNQLAGGGAAAGNNAHIIYEPYILAAIVLAGSALAGLVGLVGSVPLA
jgi:hypothetical protein